MIKSELKKVRNLLDESIKYQVPEYQRNFAWKRDQAEEFFNDLLTGSVFLGTIVLDTSKESEGIISIVDGQQRITTMFIFLAACRLQARSINSIGQAQEIQRKISFIDDTSGQASSSKLISSPSISTVFEKTIANPEWDGKKFDIKAKKRQASKVRPIYEFFVDKISQMDKDELKDLLRRLYESTFISIEVQEAKEAFDIFERTNARGMELNAADLLKNYLFANTNSDNLTLEWNTIVDNSAGNILRLIKYYYVSNHGLVLKSDLFKDIKRHGDSIGPDQLLAKLKDFSYYYNLITVGSLENIVEWAHETKSDYFRKEYNAEALHRALEALRLFGVTQSHPLLVKLLLALDSVTEEDRVKVSEKVLAFFKAIEKFHFLNYAVSQRPGNQIESYYAGKCTQPLSPSNLVVFMKEMIDELRKEKVVKESEFVEKFADLSYGSDSTLIYYIYDRLNNVGRTGGQYIALYNPDKKLLRRNYDIDHLVSQDATNYDFSEEELVDYIDSIGNLLVISKHTNGALQNKNILEKFDVLMELEAQNLPEAATFVRDFKAQPWSSAEDVVSNIKTRSLDLGHRAYTTCWKI